MIEPGGTERETFITLLRVHAGDGEPFRVAKEDIVHFRFGLDPDDDPQGLLPLKSVLREVFTDDEAARSPRRLLRTWASPA
jgi:hypothetical protein